MTKHALFSASASSKWLNCPASLLVESNYKDITTVYAEEGTAAHELAELCLKRGAISSLIYQGTVVHDAIIEGELVEFEADFTMCEAVDEYLNVCYKLINSGGSYFIEEKVNYDNYCIKDKSFGTSDFIHVKHNNKHGQINIIDLKYGQGVKVSADSSQCKLYALGAYEKLRQQTHKIAALSTSKVKVKTVIVQPRMSNYDEREYTLKELLLWARDELKPKAWLAYDIYQGLLVPEFNAGEKQCTFCKAKHDCKALAAYNFNKISLMIEDISEKPKLPDDALLTNKDKANIVLASKFIINWLDSLKDYVEKDMLAGELYEGVKLVRGRQSRRWSSEEKAADAMRKKAKLKVAQIYEKKLLTPAKLEKLIGKKHEFFNDDTLISKSIGKPAIVSVNDKRVDIFEEARDAFDDLTSDPFNE